MLIRKATVTRAFYPMLCGSAFKHKGVQQLLDAVVDFLPAPSDREAYKCIDVKTGDETERRPIDSDPLSMIAFKIMTFPHVGSITFCRIYSGKLEKGMALAQTSRDKRERVGMIYEMHADDRKAIEEAFAGDIVALAGLKDTRTGETLCDPAKPVILEKMEFPNPVIEMKVEPKSKGDQEKMAPVAAHDGRRGSVLPRLGRSRVGRDASSRAWASCISTSRSTSCVASRTTSRSTSALRRSPTARRSPARPRSTTRTRSRPAAPVSSRASSCASSRTRSARATSSRARSSAVRCRRSSSRVSRRACSPSGTQGVLIGFPMVDIKVTLFDGAFHEVDSSAIAFEIASRQAMKEGASKAGVKLLEPIMDVEVVTPGDFVGGVIGDINSRRGQIRNQEMRGNATVIRAYVPLANMFGYVSQLRSMSQGRASYTMQFAHYAEVPRNVAEEVKAKYV